MSRIVSSLPGRIRVRDKRLRDQTRLTELNKQLSKIAAISTVQADARTGSVVVRFDPAAIEISELEAHLDSAVDQVLVEQLIPPPITKKQLNRYNKIAMVGSLAASLALTTARRKHWRRWHALTGYLFVASVAVHMIIYRKSLFR
ncbi:HMA2 domain-containing protein [Methylomonas methanica]|uniref:HMA domain-containing protein n=1 Tax=Methylomonas methanica (strain DSM 25384 / MC09) TaxID=857087 RepID=G0A1L6_METMM|nr:hypothetical protein [Methylomonas methanica]AEG00077.1 hypothetical protein Metme_1658 [Methylomonas methanica MC09]